MNTVNATSMALDTTAKPMPIGAIVASLIAVAIIFAILLVPSNFFEENYEWMRGRSKPKVQTNTKSTYRFFNRQLQQMTEQREREEAQRNRPFLQRHLEALRAWHQPKDVQDPEAAMFELPGPPPVAHRDPSRPKDLGYASFQKFLESKRAREPVGGWKAPKAPVPHTGTKDQLHQSAVFGISNTQHR